MLDLVIWVAVITGILSLLLPLWVLFFKKNSHKRVLLSNISIFLSLFSIALLIFYYYFLARNNDIVTLEDVVFGLLFGGNIILIGSTILNVIVLFTTPKTLK